MVPDIRKRRVDTHLVAMVILHYSLKYVTVYYFDVTIQ